VVPKARKHLSADALHELDPHVWIGGIARDIMDKAKAMHYPGSAVVSLISSHAPGMLRRLHLLEQPGMIAFFDSEKIVQPMIVRGFKMRGSGTQAIFGDNALEVRMVPTQLGHEAFGGMPFTIILKSASAERCLRSLGTTIAMAPPDCRTANRSSERGYFCMDVYEKATRMSWELLGFVTLRELLQDLQHTEKSKL
jgi:hypothetical protein